MKIALYLTPQALGDYTPSAQRFATHQNAVKRGLGVEVRDDSEARRDCPRGGAYVVYDLDEAEATTWSQMNLLDIDDPARWA